MVLSWATLHFVGWVEPLQALLGFVALNPTYIYPVLLRNAKPNNGRFRNLTPKVSIPIKLAVFSASVAARVKLHENIKANRRISNIEPQNFEGWNRSPRRRRYNPYEPEASLSLFIKLLEYLPSTFDIHDSIFDILFFKVSFSIRLDARGQRRRLYETSYIRYQSKVYLTRTLSTQRLFKAFFLSVLRDLSGEHLCFFYDQKGIFVIF